MIPLSFSSSLTISKLNLRILFLHNNCFDYLSVSLFHGLRQVLGNSCVDVPRFNLAYDDLSAAAQNNLRGRGFTLTGLLSDNEELVESRNNWRLQISQFTHLVVTDLRHTLHQALQLLKAHSYLHLIVLDGSDYTPIFPFEAIAQNYSTVPTAFSRAFRNAMILKREYEPGCEYGTLSKFLPNAWLSKIWPYQNVIPIGFSIPEEKISRVSPQLKTTTFAAQIPDEEVAAQLPYAEYIGLHQNNYRFHTEAEYYANLQVSRFGITTKRAGWDCLRHYELAANGCVPCFKNLHLKPAQCAPHGLNSSNCISYMSYDDLMMQIRKLSDQDYAQLQANAYSWVTARTTKLTANELIMRLS